MNKITVTPLGTVSPYPKGDCNCPGFLVESDGKKVLLDCGSGVSRLLKFPDDLKDLIIVISHMHLDHYSDLGSFIYASKVYHRLGKLENKIKVFYPDDYFVWQHDFLSNSAIDAIGYTDCGYRGEAEHGQYCGWEEVKNGNMKLSFSRNLHDIRTYSIKIVSNGMSIVYTADTGYNDKLVEFSKNVDLLICESSFLKKHNAQSKFHMTAYEAGLLASHAGAKKLVLTHFWPEEDKRLYLEEAQQVFENTKVAEEGKQIVLRRKSL